MLGEVQDFQVRYQNTANTDNFLNNYATGKRKKPSVIDQLESAVVSVLTEEDLGYRGGAVAEKGHAQAALRDNVKTFPFVWCADQIQSKEIWHTNIEKH